MLRKQEQNRFHSQEKKIIDGIATTNEKYNVVICDTYILLPDILNRTCMYKQYFFIGSVAGKHLFFCSGRKVNNPGFLEGKKSMC